MFPVMSWKAAGQQQTNSNKIAPSEELGREGTEPLPFKANSGGTVVVKVSWGNEMVPLQPFPGNREGMCPLGWDNHFCHLSDFCPCGSDALTWSIK